MGLMQLGTFVQLPSACDRIDMLHASSLASSPLIISEEIIRIACLWGHKSKMSTV